MQIDFNGILTHLGLFYAQEVRESYLVYVQIYIFCVIVFCTVLSNTNNLQTDLFEPEVIY